MENLKSELLSEKIFKILRPKLITAFKEIIDVAREVEIWDICNMISSYPNEFWIKKDWVVSDNVLRLGIKISSESDDDVDIYELSDWNDYLIDFSYLLYNDYRKLIGSNYFDNIARYSLLKKKAGEIFLLKISDGIVDIISAEQFPDELLYKLVEKYWDYFTSERGEFDSFFILSAAKDLNAYNIDGCFRRTFQILVF